MVELTNLHVPFSMPAFLLSELGALLCHKTPGSVKEALASQQPEMELERRRKVLSDIDIYVFPPCCRDVKVAYATEIQREPYYP